MGRLYDAIQDISGFGGLRPYDGLRPCGAPRTGTAASPGGHGAPLARSELDGLPAPMVPPCVAGHLNLSGTLRMVHGSGAAADLGMGRSGAAGGRGLSPAFRLHS